MKLVRENINEKFTKTSDPIQDMGIGQFSEEEAEKMTKDFMKYFKKTWNLEFEVIYSRQITNRFDPISEDIIIMHYERDEDDESLPDSNLWQVYFVMNRKAANLICSYYKNKELRNTIPYGWIIRVSSGIEYVQFDDLDTLHKKVLQYAFPKISDNLDILTMQMKKLQKQLDQTKKIQNFLNK